MIVTHKTIPYDIFTSFVYLIEFVNIFKNDINNNIIAFYEKMIKETSNLRVVFSLQTIVSFTNLIYNIISLFNINTKDKDNIDESVYQQFKDLLFYHTIIRYVINDVENKNIKNGMNFLIDFDKYNIGRKIIEINQFAYQYGVKDIDEINELNKKDGSKIDDMVFDSAKIYNKYFSSL